MLIELAYPHKDLMPNRKNGKHWASTVNIKKARLEEAYFVTLERVKPKIIFTGLIPLRITFVQSDNRSRDLDGLLSAMKSALDGMAKALGVDDKQFDPITVTRGRAEISKTIIEIV